MEEYLWSIYDRILVTSDENGIFPNRNMEFLKKNGYTDIGVISREEDYCTLHLMAKSQGNDGQSGI